MNRLLLFIFLAFSINLSAQVKSTAELEELLKQLEADMLIPLDAQYKTIKPLKNTIQNYQYSIRSRKEKLEIRYLFVPEDPSSLSINLPHIKAFSMASTIATNDEETIISKKNIDVNMLNEGFKADWGATYFFKPKTAFAPFPHCQMLCLHKENKGTIYVFFLFDDPNNQALDARFFAIQFLD
ncbi:MAG: hypothetical protein AAFO07_19185 [Bacteroidota bacterium]